MFMWESVPGTAPSKLPRVKMRVSRGLGSLFAATCLWAVSPSSTVTLGFLPCPGRFPYCPECADVLGIKQWAHLRGQVPADKQIREKKACLCFQQERRLLAPPSVWVGEPAGEQLQAFSEFASPKGGSDSRVSCILPRGCESGGPSQGRAAPQGSPKELSIFS